MTTIDKNGLTNSFLKKIFKEKLPNHKIYNRVEDIEKVIIQKNGSVAIGAYLLDREVEEKNYKIIKFEYTDTDSFFHMYILQWLLILLGIIPGIIWYINAMKGRSDLHHQCMNIIDDYFEEILFDESGDIYVPQN